MKAQSRKSKKAALGNSLVQFDRTHSIEPRHWDRARLKRLMKGWKKKPVLVFGDVGVDRYTVGAVERISPEAPVPIVRVEREELKLGLAANVADNIQVLGGTVRLIGLIGKDRGGQDFERLLKRQKLSAQGLVRDAGRRTILKERIVSDRQQLLRVDYEDVGSPQTRAWSSLRAQFKKQLRGAFAVVLQDYAKGTVDDEMARFIFETAREARVPVFVDPNRRTAVSRYQGASLLTPNAKEAEALSGVKMTDTASLLRAGHVILEKTGADSLIITRGKDGMAVFHRDRPVVQLIPTYAREVFDVSGAGDTVIAVVSLALACGATLEEAAILGNVAAGVVVGKRGTATVTPDEVLEMMGTIE